MKLRLTKAEAQAFVARWEAVNQAEIEELRNTSAETKFRQLAALMRSAQQMGWTEKLANEENVVRERWQTLRKRCQDKSLAKRQKRKLRKK